MNLTKFFVFYFMISNVFAVEVLMAQTGTSGGWYLLSTSSFQSFTSTLTGVLTAVAFQFSSYNCNGNPFNVLLRQGTGITGPIIATLQVTAFSGQYNQWRRIDFPTPPSIVSGQIYSLQFQCSTGFLGINGASNSYSGGANDFAPGFDYSIAVYGDSTPTVPYYSCPWHEPNYGWNSGCGGTHFDSQIFQPIADIHVCDIEYYGMSLAATGTSIEFFLYERGALGLYNKIWNVTRTLTNSATFSNLLIDLDLNATKVYMIGWNLGPFSTHPLNQWTCIGTWSSSFLTLLDGRHSGSAVMTTPSNFDVSTFTSQPNRCNIRFQLKAIQVPVFTSGDITTSRLTTSPLTSSPLTTSPVTSGQITTSPATSASVTTAPLITSGVVTTAVQITSGSVTTSPATSASLTTSPATSGAVTTSPITSASVTTSPATSGEVTTSPATSGELTTSPMTSGDMTTSHVTSGDITTSEITSGDVTTSPATSGDMTTSELTSGDITTSIDATTSLPQLTTGQFQSAGGITTSVVTGDNRPELQPVGGRGKIIGGVIGGIGGITLLGAAAFIIIKLRPKKYAFRERMGETLSDMESSSNMKSSDNGIQLQRVDSNLNSDSIYQ